MCMSYKAEDKLIFSTALKNLVEAPEKSLFSMLPHLTLLSIL